MSDEDVAVVRKFNRFFSEQIGVFNRQHLDNNTSLPERRVLYEIGTFEPIRAADISAKLHMDRSNLCRIIAKFETKNKWIERKAVQKDGRVRDIMLTPEGRQAHDQQNREQNRVIREQLESLDDVGRNDLVQALSTARLLLESVQEDPKPSSSRLKSESGWVASGPSYIIRPFRTGEVPYVSSRQAKLYKESHRWGCQLELIIMETSTAFLKNFKEGRDQCWVAEIDECIAGSVFLTDEGAGRARLRQFWVEPLARRRGIGQALVQKCIDFAREIGQKEVVLWTHTVLEPARRVYARAGFILYETEIHHQFGAPVQGEMWRIDLTTLVDQPNLVDQPDSR